MCLKQTVVIILVVGLILICAGCGTHLYHQVRPGDTLYSISWSYAQDYRQLAEWNEIPPPYLIHEGQWLRVAPPHGDAAVRTLSAAPVPARPEPGRTAPPLANPVSQPPPQDPMATRAEIRWIWPVAGRVVEKFNPHSPANQGIGISAAMGAPVYAAAAGKVVYSGNGLRGYGNLVILKHNDKYLSAYGHNKQLLAIEGANVKQGDVIAYVGNSESERVQLHFQIRIDGKPVDPLRYLP